MNCNIWQCVRQLIYGCFPRSRDALFELVDTRYREPEVRSLPELSMAAVFRRTWGNTYEALEDEQRWSEIWTPVLLTGCVGPLWISIDSTRIARPEAETSPHGGMIYLPNLPHANKPVSVGWQFSTVMLLLPITNNWGAIPALRRLKSSQTAVEVAIDQLRKPLPLVGTRRRMLADRWYATGAFVCACQKTGIGALIRLKRNRKLYRPVPPKQPSRPGAPRKDDDLFQGSQPETWGQVDAEWAGPDEHSKEIQVQAWHHLHFHQACEVELTVKRWVRMASRDTKRDPPQRFPAIRQTSKRRTKKPVLATSPYKLMNLAHNSLVSGLELSLFSSSDTHVSFINIHEKG